MVFAPFAKAEDDGTQRMSLAVSGVHCASCIQLIENTLNAQDDVLDARVNMSTERLNLQWQGKPERADALAKLVTDLGYGLKPLNDNKLKKEEGNAEEKALLWRIAIAGFAAGNLMLISVGLWSSTIESMGGATHDLFHWLSALIALPALAYTAQPFFGSAFNVLKRGHTNMDVPISLAILLAAGMSVLETYQHGQHIYFDSAAMLTFFLLIGRYLDARAKGKARESAKGLLAMLSGTATVLEEGGKTRVVAMHELRAGMKVLVAVGENVPADGVVLKGESSVDMSLITGETLPETVRKDSKVFAGTVNLDAPLTIEVAKATESSLLSDIVKLMEKAEQGQARYVQLADKVARAYTPVVHFLAAASFLYWWGLAGMEWQPALLIAVTVLIITCPCALGLAVPVVQVLASGRLMKRGILLKSGDALEKLAQTTTAIFDKTGTLTIGKPSLEKGRWDEEDLQRAASLAVHSKHPLSKSVSAAYEGNLLEADDVKEMAGKGVEGRVDGVHVQLGSRPWCGDEAADAPTGPEIWLKVGEGAPVRFAFTDPLREDVKEILGKLKASGYSLHMLSGDRKQVAEAVAREVVIDQVRAEISPKEKYAYIEALHERGETTLMVGDGLNDAPSLALAHTSISPASATDMAQNAADVVFQGDALAPVLEAIFVAKKSQSLIKQNFALALVYNMIAVPLALMGMVTPLIAAIAMSSSSILVVANSFRLNRMENQ